jgi:glycine hydroxymethyltransferase
MTHQQLLQQILEIISTNDPEIGELILAENTRQARYLPLIASENFSSLEVLLTLSCSLSNKYAEGYPHKWKEGKKELKNGRYYRGQSQANKLERLAIDRALQLFTDHPDAYHANVQPLSGSPANLAVLNAFLEPGDTLMGLSLAYGGHLTHGHKVNVTGRYYRAVQYELGENDRLDYEAIEKMAMENKPKLIICGYTAYPFKIDFERLGKIAKKANSILLADISHICGLCTSGLHPHPFPHADVMMTTTHKILRGPRAAVIITKKEYGERIDKSVFPGLQGGPHLNTIAAMAVAFKKAMTAEYHQYAAQVVKNAVALAEGLAAEGFRLVGNGTENHLMLVDVVKSAEDVRVKNGSVFAQKLEKAGIVCNMNTVPGDLRPLIPSGIRLGTPAVTSLDMKEAEMKQIAFFIAETARHLEDEVKLAEIKKSVAELMTHFCENANFCVYR